MRFYSQFSDSAPSFLALEGSIPLRTHWDGHKMWDTVHELDIEPHLKTENVQFLMACHYFCLQNVPISFEYADFYAKNLTNFGYPS